MYLFNYILNFENTFINLKMIPFSKLIDESNLKDYKKVNETVLIIHSMF